MELLLRLNNEKDILRCIGEVVIMSFIDSYRNNILRKREEITKISQDKARESAKIPSLNQKIISAKNAISRTTSTSTIRSRWSEIERAEKDIASVNKKIADLEKKIAQKDKELAAEEKKLRDEEAREQRKKDETEKKRIQESERQLQKINRAIKSHDIEQAYIRDEINRLKCVPETITVLFMASNPVNSTHLRLDEEARSIQEMIRKSEHRDSVKFESRWAARPLDILQAINELNPDVIHFSGHGSPTGELVLQDANGNAKFVTTEAITQTIMTSSEKIHLIFFNSCFSYEQAESIVEHVDAAIGMTDSIGDVAACTFAAQFYSSIGFGLSLQKAFDQAKAALLLEGIDERNTPELYIKDGLIAEKIFIVRPDID